MYLREDRRLSKVYVLAEGRTEQAFVRQILSPVLGVHGIYLHDVLLGKPGHKGGIRNFEVVKREIKSLLKQETSASVTTLFDRYGLPSNWPGLADSNTQTDIAKAHALLCRSMHEIVREEMGASFRAERFIPYIQYYEIEALLFVKPVLTAELLGNLRHADELGKAVQEAGGCEQINDGPSTAPSKRIERLFKNYKKGGSINTDLSRICDAVGLDSIRAACPLFANWIGQLLRLDSSSTSGNTSS